MRDPRRLAALLAALGLPLAAAGAQAQTPGGEPPSAPPATRTPLVRSPGNAQWASTPEDAREAASAAGKLVFVEFDRKECGHCQRMDGLLYPAFDFEALLIPMVPVKVDLDSAPGAELARRYGVGEAPSILIITPEGRLVFRMEGFVNAPDFYAHVRRDLDTYRKFARRLESQDVAALPAAEALETGRELYKRLDPAAAIPRLRRAAAARPGTAAQRDEAREILAAAELDVGDSAAARRTIDRLITTTRDGARRERAELFRAQIPLSENRPEEALALYRRFLRDHPRSPYRARVDELIARLSGAPSSR